MRISEMTFRNQEIILDFHDFDHCVFEQCEMVVHGYGSFKLIDSQMVDCHWRFEGPASTTMSILADLYHSGPGGRDIVEHLFETIRNQRLRE